MKRIAILLLVLSACGGEDEQTGDADNPCPPGASEVGTPVDYPYVEVWCRTASGTPHGHARLENTESGCWKVEGFHNSGDRCGQWVWRDDACEFSKDREYPPCPY
jgi:hypothetical protein